MLPKRVSIIDMVSASNACRLSRGDAQVFRSPRNDALREFKNLSLLFAMPSDAIRRIVATKGELFCIT